jgi:hypothetical protein
MNNPAPAAPAAHEIIREAPDGGLYCARPGATATWDEWLAACTQQDERIRAGLPLRDVVKDTGDIMCQYTIIRSEQERAAALQERLDLYRGKSYRPKCRQDDDRGRECGRPVTTFIQDPSGPDALTCARHAWPYTEQDLERQITSTGNARDELARLERLGAELAAIGRCGKVGATSFTPATAMASICPLAAAHDGPCETATTLITVTSSTTAAEAERELASLRAKLARLAAERAGGSK